jgi:hypothetical protein
MDKNYNFYIPDRRSSKIGCHGLDLDCRDKSKMWTGRTISIQPIAIDIQESWSPW